MGQETLRETLIISAGLGYKTQTDVYSKDCIAQRPYKDTNLVERVLREIWFRLQLPEKVWYKKVEEPNNIKAISVQDPLITRCYLEWLREQFPEARISYDYCNLVGKSRHLLPEEVPDGVTLTTYDRSDSEKYGMVLREGGEFSISQLREKQPIEYDIFYVGADKGRAEYLLLLKKQFEEMGLKTKMIITADKRFSFPNKIYSKPIPYEQVLDYDAKSRAIMNIVLPGQMGATKRDFEALFLKAKLITNNKNIKTFDFYEPKNVFILGEDNMEDLPKFVREPFVEVDPKILDKHLQK